MSGKYIIRSGDISDKVKLAELEGRCFPKAEAATLETFEKRLEVYSDQFVIVEDGDRIIAVVNGPVTRQKDLTDEMYADTSYHDPKGEWKMIFGVETDPAYQRKGIASLAMRQCIEQAGKEGRKGLVLTCKENLIGFYERFGFVSEGVSGSEHGGATWYQMRLLLHEESVFGS